MGATFVIKSIENVALCGLGRNVILWMRPSPGSVCGFLNVYLCNGCIEFLFKYVSVHLLS
jgi:hypothetical protein